MEAVPDQKQENKEAEFKVDPRAYEICHKVISGATVGHILVSFTPDGKINIVNTGDIAIQSLMLVALQSHMLTKFQNNADKG